MDLIRDYTNLFGNETRWNLKSKSICLIKNKIRTIDLQNYLDTCRNNTQICKFMFHDRPTTTEWINDHVQKVCKNFVRKRYDEWI